MEAAGNRCPVVLGDAAREVNQHGARLHQHGTRTHHEQIGLLPRVAEPDRIQQLRIHTRQPRQLPRVVRIAAVAPPGDCLQLPRIRHYRLVP